MGKCGPVDHADLWDEEAARRYDTPGVGMFAPEVLGALSSGVTVGVLIRLPPPRRRGQRSGCHFSRSAG